MAKLGCGNGVRVVIPIEYPAVNAKGEPFVDAIAGMRIYLLTPGAHDYVAIADVEFPVLTYTITGLTRGTYAVRCAALGHAVKADGQEDKLCILEGCKSDPRVFVVNDVPPGKATLLQPFIPCPTSSDGVCCA